MNAGSEEPNPLVEETEDKKPDGFCDFGDDGGDYDKWESG